MPARNRVRGCWRLGNPSFRKRHYQPCRPKGGFGPGILDIAMMRSQSSGESHVIHELVLSKSAWLIESHWPSCRLPEKTKSSASRSGNYGALSGSKAWPDSNFAEATAIRLALSPAGTRAP